MSKFPCSSNTVLRVEKSFVKNKEGLHIRSELGGFSCTESESLIKVKTAESEFDILKEKYENIVYKYEEACKAIDTLE